MYPKHIRDQIIWMINDVEVWKAFEVMLQHRLETLRANNDNVLGHEEFLKNQGSIREIKELMNMQKRIVADHAKGK